MARTVKTFPPDQRGRAPRVSKYEPWLDGQVWKLVEGKDFTMPAKSLIPILRTLAKRRGLKARAVVRPDGVYVQANPR